VSHSHTVRPIPRGILIGAAVMIAVSIALAGVARMTGVGAVRVVSDAAAVESRDLRFTDQRDGSIVILDVATEEVVTVVAPATNGFIRGALRGLARERRQQGVGAGPAFRLVRWADGRLTIEDPVTSRVIDLTAFGPTNTAAFAALLASRGSTR
jgi:putative photosynthetic complex assembly protein